MTNRPNLLVIWRITSFVWMNLAVLYGYKLKPNNKWRKMESTVRVC